MGLFKDSSVTNEVVRLNALYRAICSVLSLSLEYSSEGIMSDVPEADLPDYESILDKYFLLGGTDPVTNPNITQVLPSSTYIEVATSSSFE